MIEVTRINNSKFMINEDLIQTIEETPDTVITLTTGTKFVVKESSKELTNMIIKYKRMIFCDTLRSLS